MCFVRGFNDMEIEEADALFNRLQGQNINSEREDVMLWNHSNQGIFTFKSCYMMHNAGSGKIAPLFQ